MSLSARTRSRLLIVGGLILAVLALLAILSQVATNAYLQSNAFRKLAEWQLGRSLEARAEVMPIRWDNGSAYTDGINIEGGPETPFREFRASHIRASVTASGFVRRKWSVDELRAGNARLVFDNDLARAVPPEAERPKHWSDFLLLLMPRDVNLDHLLFEDADIEWHSRQLEEPGVAEDLRVRLSPRDGAWLITGDAGRLRQPGLPVMIVDHFNLRFQEPVLFLQNARLLPDPEGAMEASGEFHFEEETYDVDLRWNGIPAETLVPSSWRVKLAGPLEGRARVTGDFHEAQAARISGRASLRQGRLEALPVLEQLAAFTGSERFRSLVVHQAGGDFVWSDGQLAVTDFMAESEGLIRMEGFFTVVDGEIDGDFELGVTASTVQWIPGAASKVFTESRGGYVWTPLEVSGPVESPNEDLSGRLVRAARDQVIDDLSEGAGAAEETLRNAADRLFDFLRGRE